MTYNSSAFFPSRSPSLAENLTSYIFGDDQGAAGNSRKPLAMFGNQAEVAPDPHYLSPKFGSFLRTYLPIVQPIAQQRNVDPASLLGLSALESNWGMSSMALKQNNPFGATPHGFTTRGVHYDTPQSAWQHWDAQWGPRVQGSARDPQRFINQLRLDNSKRTDAVDQRGPYNTENSASGGDPLWSKKVDQTIDGVRKRLPQFLKNGC